VGFLLYVIDSCDQGFVDVGCFLSSFGRISHSSEGLARTASVPCVAFFFIIELWLLKAICSLAFESLYSFLKYEVQTAVCLFGTIAWNTWPFGSKSFF